MIIKIHRNTKEGAKMFDNLIDGLVQKMLGEQLRKFISAACGAWITVLVGKGVVTQPDVNTFVQVLVAVLIYVGNALWTRAMNKIQDKTAITVPTVTVPAIAAFVGKVK